MSDWSRDAHTDAEIVHALGRLGNVLAETERQVPTMVERVVDKHRLLIRRRRRTARFAAAGLSIGMAAGAALMNLGTDPQPSATSIPADEPQADSRALVYSLTYDEATPPDDPTTTAPARGLRTAVRVQRFDAATGAPVDRVTSDALTGDPLALVFRLPDARGVALGGIEPAAWSTRFGGFRCEAPHPLWVIDGEGATSSVHKNLRTADLIDVAANGVLVAVRDRCDPGVDEFDRQSEVVTIDVTDEAADPRTIYSVSPDVAAGEAPGSGGVSGIVLAPDGEHVAIATTVGESRSNTATSWEVAATSGDSVVTLEHDCSGSPGNVVMPLLRGGGRYSAVVRCPHDIRIESGMVGEKPSASVTVAAVAESAFVDHVVLIEGSSPSTLHVSYSVVDGSETTARLAIVDGNTVTGVPQSVPGVLAWRLRDLPLSPDPDLTMSLDFRDPARFATLQDGSAIPSLEPGAAVDSVRAAFERFGAPTSDRRGNRLTVCSGKVVDRDVRIIAWGNLRAVFTDEAGSDRLDHIELDRGGVIVEEGSLDHPASWWFGRRYDPATSHDLHITTADNRWIYRFDFADGWPSSVSGPFPVSSPQDESATC